MNWDPVTNKEWTDRLAFFILGLIVGALAFHGLGW